MNYTDYWLWLTLKDSMTNIKIHHLIEHFFYVDRIYDADKEALVNTGFLKENDIEELLDKSFKEVNKVKEKCEYNNIKIITIEDKEYPEKLRHIYDMPYVLYYMGKLPDFDNMLSIAMVGTRRASPYGSEIAHKISYDLANYGVIIVSGLARGIDSFSHKGCLNAGGITVAVVGTGLDIVYPRENRELMEFICRNGAVISEYPPGTKPERYHFPERNRLMSALSDGVLVVEASEKSGSFITVDFANEHGKDVFAVPGSIFSPQCAGTNNLLKQGAKVTTSYKDVLESYGNTHKLILNESNTKNSYEDNNIKKDVVKIKGLSDDENIVVSCLSCEKGTSIDEIVRETGLPIGKLSSLLTILEMKGYIQQQAFKMFILTNI